MMPVYANCAWQHLKRLTCTCNGGRAVRTRGSVVAVTLAASAVTFSSSLRRVAPLWGACLCRLFRFIFLVFRPVNSEPRQA